MAPSDRTALVTGAARGIGLAIARRLAGDGLRVALLDQDRDRVEAAARDVGHGAIALVADVTRSAEVDAALGTVVERWGRLDVLVNNAGIYASTRAQSAEGFELTLAVNQLAPFLLTHLLIEAGVFAAGARIVFVSSNVHRGAGALDFDDLDRTRDWDGYSAYADSKLMNVATAFELARRLAGRKIAVNAMHPGVIGTKLLHRGFGGSGGAGVARGAAGEVKLAIDPALEGVTGRYYDQTEESRASAAAQDRALQARVYEVCLERTGERAV